MKCDDCRAPACSECGGCMCDGNECDCAPELAQLPTIVEDDESLFDADELGLDPEEHDLMRRGWPYA